MRYSNKECELLRLVWIDSEDDDPPFYGAKIFWRGKEVPFVLRVSWKGPGYAAPDSVVIHVTTKQQRGYLKDEDPMPLYNDMRKHGVTICDWPKKGNRLYGKKEW